jgi:serine/threonine protein kinase
MASQSQWERARPEALGKGGQSTVYLVRRPERKAARDKSFQTLKALSGQGFSESTALEFAQASLDVSRPEDASELGALKIFNPRAGGAAAEQQAQGRLKNEIELLKQNRPGLLRLLDSNESENWIVTEYCANGTLAEQLTRFTGNARLALESFFPLVQTVAALHKESIVHRDIKPQNIFVVEPENRLVLGDFGIVFLPNQSERLSFTGESVGPRDFMPPWVLIDDQPGNINPTFDVYMLGKVLWCMVTGRLKLHREDFKEPRLNVVNIFPSDPYMHVINEILEKCVVTREKDCLFSAIDLVLIVGAYLEMMRRGGNIQRNDVPRPCKVCGVGYYLPVRDGGSVAWALHQRVNNVDQHIGVLHMSPFECTRCGNVQVFKTKPVAGI